MADISLLNAWKPRRVTLSGTANRMQRFVVDRNMRSVTIRAEASDCKLFYGVQNIADDADVSTGDPATNYVPLVAGAYIDVPISREKFKDPDNDTWTFGIASASTSVVVLVDPHPRGV